MKYEWYDYVAFIVIGSLILFLILLLFVILPRTLVVERQCLQAGYPKSTIDYTLTGYCMNLEGTVTVKVQEIK